MTNESRKIGIARPFGFLVLDKPEGITSHDCVYRVRKIFGIKQVGHGGTLDPAVTGVLPIAFKILITLIIVASLVHSVLMTSTRGIK